jgi:hypothetical protein
MTSASAASHRAGHRGRFAEASSTSRHAPVASQNAGVRADPGGLTPRRSLASTDRNPKPKAKFWFDINYLRSNVGTEFSAKR